MNENFLQKLCAIHERWRERLMSFGAVVALEGISQAITLLTALVVVRTLSTENYGIYSIAASILGMMAVLSDSGMSSGVSALLGRVWQNEAQLARLVRTALRLRAWLWVIMVPAAAGMMISMLWTKVPKETLLVLGLLVFATSFIALYGVLLGKIPLFTGKRVAAQVVQVASGLARLVTIGFILWVGKPGPVTYSFAALVGALATYAGLKRIIGYDKMRGAAIDPAYRHELVRVIRKMMPQSLFFTFQGQITTFILAWFGTLREVASVNALARIALAFSIIGRVSILYLGPAFSKQPNRDAARSYFVRAALVGLVPVVAVFAIIAFFPTLFLLLLGENYHGLEQELRIAVLASAIYCYGSIIWQLLASRALVALAWLYIPATLVAQIVSASFLDISSLRGALWFSLAGSVAFCGVNLYQAYCLILINRKSA